MKECMSSWIIDPILSFFILINFLTLKSILIFKIHSSFPWLFLE